MAQKNALLLGCLRSPTRQKVMQLLQPRLQPLEVQRRALPQVRLEVGLQAQQAEAMVPSANSVLHAAH